MSTGAYGHDKSYYFDELYPVLNGKVKAIFAGDSKRQYFLDFEDKYESNKPNWGKQNYNLIYWCDKVGDIATYSVGTSTGIPKLGFVKVTVKANDSELTVEPFFVSANYSDPIPREFIQFNPKDFKSHELDRNRNKAGVISYQNGAWFLIGVFFTLLGIPVVVCAKKIGKKILS